MAISKKLQWRHALSQLRYCNEELQYTIEASKAFAPEFESFYRKFCAENKINITQLDNDHKERLNKLYGNQEIADKNAQNQSEINGSGDSSIVLHDKSFQNNNNSNYEMTADDIAMHDAFSKLFKKIALKLHPDRISKSLPKEEVEMRINMFQNANQAYEDKKYYVLLEYAESFNISTPKNYDQQIRWMKRESQKIIKQVDKEKNTYNYGFSQLETEQEKEELIKKFLFQLFKVRL